jgi:UDP-N-acetylmuramate--alanine ligase
VKVLSLADELLLLDIYPAGEEPIPGISSQLLLDKICHNSGRAQLTSPQNLSEKLNQLVSNGCAVLMQGAGNISQLAQNLISSHAVKNS